MGLFVRDDDYNESVRMTGFNRYKQLMSFYAGHYTILNIITFVGALPLIAGIFYAVASTSLVLLIPFSLMGGGILGPFLAALIDSIQRGLRDDRGLRWDNYRKGFKQNIKVSILPGAFTGIIIGLYTYVFYLNFYTDALTLNGFSYIALLLAFALFLNFENLFWPQLVLFNQSLSMTITNIILFSAKHLYKLLLLNLLQLLYLFVFVIFAPYTLIVVPFIGIWYFCFFSQFRIYDTLNEELHIEEKFSSSRFAGES